MALNEYKIRKANTNDIEGIIQIIEKRCKWFKEKGINQWEYYLEVYDKSYFKSQIKTNKLYVALKDNQIVGLYLLKEDDFYWNDDVSAFYLHHLATDINCKGLGKVLLDDAIKKCQKYHKKYLRLDCLKENEKLNEYYKLKGFKYISSGEDEYYKYNLYELEI